MKGALPPVQETIFKLNADGTTTCDELSEWLNSATESAKRIGLPIELHLVVVRISP